MSSLIGHANKNHFLVIQFLCSHFTHGLKSEAFPKLVDPKVPKVPPNECNFLGQKKRNACQDMVGVGFLYQAFQLKCLTMINFFAP